MSIIKLSKITNQKNTSGPVIAGITTFTGTQSARFPVGNNSERVGIESGSLRYNNTAKLLEFYDGTEWKFILPAEESANALGVFGGGIEFFFYTYVFREIEYITISTEGNGIIFGNLSRPITYVDACSSSTRGVFGGGYNFAVTFTKNMDYISFTSKGNSSLFGELNMQAAHDVAACSSSTRGIFWGGDIDIPPRAVINNIDYITIATLSNATDFGDLSEPKQEGTSFSSSTRGIYAAGHLDQNPLSPANTTNKIEYITIATLGNGTDFGDLPSSRNYSSSLSSSTRGVIAGGDTSFAILDSIDYVTIATTGDAINFGDLTEPLLGAASGCSSSTRGIFGDVVYSEYITFYDYITIATTGNAIKFGDCLYNSSRFKASCSNNHGGLL